MLKTLTRVLLASTALIMLVAAFSVFFSPTKAFAAKEKVDPGSLRIFDGQICPALQQKVPESKLKSNCVDYMYQADLDAAYHKICDVHGAGGTKKLEDECNTYKNYTKGSFKPVSGDSASCADGSCTDPAANPNANCDNDSCDYIKKYINPGINLLSMVFGIIATISLIVGGIQFSASEGDPQKAAQAKNRISNTIFAIVAYFFLYAFIQFLIPGGLLK